jgi:hypothetical protein
MAEEGLLEESEKFFTLGEIALISQYLWALSTNAGYMRICASASYDASTAVETSQLAVSKNNV